MINLAVAENPSEPQVAPCDHVVWLGSLGTRTLVASNCCRCHPELTVKEALATAGDVVEENPPQHGLFLHWSSNAETKEATDLGSSWWSTL